MKQAGYGRIREKSALLIKINKLFLSKYTESKYAK